MAASCHTKSSSTESVIQGEGFTIHAASLEDMVTADGADAAGATRLSLRTATDARRRDDMGGAARSPTCRGCVFRHDDPWLAPRPSAPSSRPRTQVTTGR